jgi:predicted aspartyl protease
MSDVGTFRTTVAIEHPARRGTLRTVADVLVDTGSDLTWIPRAVLEDLGVARERTQRLRLADGRILERGVGFAIVHVEGRSTNDDVVFAEPGDLVLLGARSLEGLNLRVDPSVRRLVDGGPIVAASAQGKGSRAQKAIA